MTLIIRVIFFIVVAFSSYSSFCEGNEIRINEEITDKQYKSYINEFQSVFGKQMEREFNLTWIEGGFGRHFATDTIEFFAYRRATLEEARALELSVLNKLAEAIRADPKMLSYLNQLSLTAESIGVDISFVYLHHFGYDDGSIDTVHSNYSKGDKKRYLRYTATDPFSDYSAEKDEAFRTDFEESFEDAIKLNAATSIINPTIHESTGFEEELGQILTSFEEEMYKKHSLRFQSSGWMLAGKSTPDISEIRTKCMYLYPVNCQEARALILLASEKLLTAMNNSETLRPYLKEYPFSASRLKLRILFRKHKYFVGNVPYYDGSMESVVLNGNAITYYHHMPNIHDKIIYAKESYQEAQTTFENTPPPTTSEKINKWIKNITFTFNKFVNFVFYIFFYVLFFIMIIISWFFTILFSQLNFI